MPSEKGRPKPHLLYDSIYSRHQRGCGSVLDHRNKASRINFWFPSAHDGEGNGTPLQHSCLENPRDGGAWKAAVHGVAESDMTEVT